MKGAVILGNSKLKVREVPKPEVKPGWVLVKVMASGLCGSDLHAYRASPETSRLYGKVVGHEPAGIVEAIGERVSFVKPGDRVSIYHYFGCGHCEFCLAGYRQFCRERSGIAAAGYGSCAEYVLAPEANCLPLPDALSYVDGAFMACTGATAYSALRKLGSLAEGDMVIFGLGPVGLSVLLEAKALGAHILGVEVLPERIALAKKLGADEVIDASATDPVQAIRDLTHGRGVGLGVEASGSTAGRTQIIECLGYFGKGVFIGLGSDQKVINPSQLIQAERTLMGSSVLPMGLYTPMARFLVERHVQFERMVTHRFSIDEAPKAFEIFDQGHTGKVVLEFR